VSENEGVGDSVDQNGSKTERKSSEHRQVWNSCDGRDGVVEVGS